MKWIEEQEVLYWKKFYETMQRLDWEMYEAGSKRNNENISLWKQLRNSTIKIKKNSNKS